MTGTEIVRLLVGAGVAIGIYAVAAFAAARWNQRHRTIPARPWTPCEGSGHRPVPNTVRLRTSEIGGWYEGRCPACGRRMVLITDYGVDEEVIAEHPEVAA